MYEPNASGNSPGPACLLMRHMHDADHERDVVLTARTDAAGAGPDRHTLRRVRSGSRDGHATRIDQRLREKYGWADRWVRCLGADKEDTLVVRLYRMHSSN